MLIENNNNLKYPMTVLAQVSHLFSRCLKINLFSFKVGLSPNQEGSKVHQTFVNFVNEKIEIKQKSYFSYLLRF